MNIKFVVGGLAIIGALFVGTEMYWQKQFEQQVRDDFKKIAFPQEVHNAIKSLPLEVDVLNQYPNIFFYINFTQDLPSSASQERLASEFQKSSHQMSCGYFSFIQTREAEDKYKDKTKAVINVIQDDHVVITNIIKNRRGDVLFEKKQILADCPEFITLKQSL